MQSKEKCFWNGAADRGEFHGYQPCQEVQEMWSVGVTAFEISSTPAFDGQPSFNPQPDVLFYPTGQWLVINEDSELFEIVPNASEVLEAKRMYVSPDIFALLMQLAEEPA